MPKGRYAIMGGYMPKVGKLGLDMMLRTCTVQVNLDFASEADMVRKFRVSMALQPIATALFANSPFVEGRPSGYLSYRSHIWTDTDPDRSGMLPFVFEPGMGFERYVDYALDVPMYFVYRDGRYIDASGQSFRDFMAGRLPALPGERPTLSDWARPSDHGLPRGAAEAVPRDARRRCRLLALAVRPAGAVDRAALRRCGTGCRRRAGARLDGRGARLSAGRGAADRVGARRSATAASATSRATWWRSPRPGSRPAPGSTGTARTRPATSTGWSRSPPTAAPRPRRSSSGSTRPGAAGSTRCSRSSRF